MSFIIEQTVMFSHQDLRKVPESTVRSFYNYVSRLRDDPDTMPFPPQNIKPLRGYVDLWRLRIGDYHLIYKQKGKHVTCLRIGRRDNIYNYFNYNSEQEILTVRIVPGLPTYVKIDPTFQNQIEETIQKETDYRKTPLPEPLSPAMLDHLQVEDEYHELLVGISTEEELLDLEGVLLKDVLETILDKIFPPEVTMTEIPDTLTIECPIEGCNKIFQNTRSGWDSHIASVNNHRNWHSDVTDGVERRRLFRDEFPDWFGFTGQELTRVKWLELFRLLQKYVSAGKITTYGDLAQRMFKKNAAPAIVSMLNGAINTDSTNQKWTNRVVNKKGECKIDGQRKQLQEEGIPFTDDGRVNFNKISPVIF